MTAEEWRPVVGYEGLYEVSTLGRVKSLARTCRAAHGFRGVAERILSPCIAKNGYLCVALYIDGSSRTWMVHRLVALAFLGPEPVGHEVCHGDGDKLNPRLENLRWGTRSDNMQDALRHGTHPTASKTHCPYGHPYSAENTRATQGKRECRTCIKRWWRASNARRRVSA